MEQAEKVVNLGLTVFQLQLSTTTNLSSDPENFILWWAISSSVTMTCLCVQLAICFNNDFPEPPTTILSMLVIDLVSSLPLSTSRARPATAVTAN